MLTLKGGLFMILSSFLYNSALNLSLEEINGLIASLEEKLYEEYWFVTRKQDYSSDTLVDLQINLQRLKILLRNYDKLNKAYILKADGLLLFSNKLDTFDRVEAFDRVLNSKANKEKYSQFDVSEL